MSIYFCLLPLFNYPFLIRVPKCSKGLSHLRGLHILRQIRGSTGCLARWGRSLPLGSCSVRDHGYLSCVVAAQSARACVLDGQKFGCALSCQASGAANHAGCPLVVVMPKKLSCKACAAQVFPRASHTVTRWHINISRVFSHSLICGVHNIFEFQLPFCHNHMWHVMFYFKICTCPNFTWEF